MKKSQSSFPSNAKTALITMAVLNLLFPSSYAGSIFSDYLDTFFFFTLLNPVFGILAISLFIEVWRLGELKHRVLGGALLVVPLPSVLVAAKLILALLFARYPFG